MSDITKFSNAAGEVIVIHAAKEEAFRLLLEANITNDFTMQSRIAEVLGKVIAERDAMVRYKDETIAYISRINEMKSNIKRILDGEIVSRWESDEECY